MSQPNSLEKHIERLEPYKNHNIHINYDNNTINGILVPQLLIKQLRSFAHMHGLQIYFYPRQLRHKYDYNNPEHIVIWDYINRVSFNLTPEKKNIFFKSNGDQYAEWLDRAILKKKEYLYRVNNRLMRP